MSKQLLIENGFITDLKISNELKESISLANGKGDTLVVKNVPCTILNRKNQNGRIYSTKELQKAIKNASEQIRTKQLLCQADEHPEGSFVAPTHASHVVTNVYIKPNVEVVVEGTKGRYDMLFMDWEVLDTDEGRNLKALLKAECSVGTSIRGLGDMEGDQVVDYELLGVDVVSNPSSGTFTRMPVKESITVELKKENELKEDIMQEAYTVEAETNDTVANTDLASQLLSKLDSPEAVGSLAKASVKFDTEVDADTGSETTVTILTTNTADDVNNIQQALELAGKKLASNIGTTDSVTITRLEDEDLAKESIEEAVSKYVLRSEEEGQVVYYVSDTEVPANDIANATMFDTYENADNIRTSIADVMWPNASWTVEEVPVAESTQKEGFLTTGDINISPNVNLSTGGIDMGFLGGTGSMNKHGDGNNSSASDQDATSNQTSKKEDSTLTYRDAMIAFEDMANYKFSDNPFLHGFCLGMANQIKLGIKSGKYDADAEVKDLDFKAGLIKDLGVAESEVSQEDNTLTVTDDEGNEYVNTFDNEKEAKAAANAITSEDGEVNFKEEKVLALDPSIIDSVMALVADTFVPGAGTIYIASQGLGIDPAAKLKDLVSGEEDKKDTEDKEKEDKKSDEKSDEDKKDKKKDTNDGADEKKDESLLQEDDMLDTPFEVDATSDMSNNASEKTYGYALKILAGDFKDWYVKNQTNPVEIGPELKDAVVFDTADEAVSFQQNNDLMQYQYENGTYSPVEVVEISISESVVTDENLYSKEDEPSDELITETEPEEKETYELTLSDIDYDINVEEWSEEDLQQIVDQAQDVIHTTEKLTSSEASDHNYLIGLMAIKTGLPIKDGKIEVKKEVKAPAVEEASEYNPLDHASYENDNPMDNVDSTIVNIYDSDTRDKYVQEWKNAGLTVIPLENGIGFKVIGDAEKIAALDEYFHREGEKDEFDSVTRNYI